MKPRTINRKTTRSTRAEQKKKPAVQPSKEGQLVVIQQGPFRGQRAAVLKATQKGIIVAVQEPITKRVNNWSWQTQQRVESERTKSKHRLVLVPHGSFENYSRANPQAPHAKLSPKQQWLARKKLAQLFELHEKLKKAATYKERTAVSREIAELRKELRYL